MSVIYFVQAGAGGSIKIGLAGEITTRVAALQTGCPHLLIVLATIPGVPADERRLHTMLRADHVRGEWFRPAPNVLAAVEAAKEGRFPEALGRPADQSHFSHIRNIVGLFRSHIRCRGVSVIEFASACGLHRNTLSGCSRDDWNPTLSTLLAIETELLRRTHEETPPLEAAA